ncbi:MAG: SDR family NAD(P)-dependent oxidoreductase [Candidatus Hodarchaeota archaeon]
MNLGLKGKHALITGGSSGIGLEITRVFLDEEMQVTATYNHSREELDQLAEKWADALCIVQVDVRNEVDVENLFLQATDSFGRVDILVTSAGVANHEGRSLQEMPLAQWENTFAVNVTGTFLCAKYFFANLDSHRDTSASLILIGSTAGAIGEAWYSDYSSSKAALHGLMMSLKNEIPLLARHGRVNLINPGWTLTPMAEDALTDAMNLRRILQTIPMRKIASVSDVANAALYLASDILSGHISGQTITVSGGMEGRVLFTPDEIDLSSRRGTE